MPLFTIKASSSELPKVHHNSHILNSKSSAYSQIKSLLLASESRSVASDSLWPHGPYSPWNSPGQNAGVGSLSLLQGSFPTPGPKLTEYLTQEFSWWSGWLRLHALNVLGISSIPGIQ